MNVPIQRDKRDRYPADWALRSRFVRQYRARNRCEWCGVANYSVGQREGGVFRPAAGNLVLDCAGRGRAYPSLEPITYAQARAIAAHLNDWGDADPRYIVIVLTVAHVFDKRPEAASLLNLAALCQRCHNRHDRAQRKASARASRHAGRAGMASLSLFLS